MDRFRGVLGFLREGNSFVSGDRISQGLSISRTAVWKYINQLERMGYRMDKVKGKGYRLLKTPDKAYPWEVERYLDTSTLGRELLYKDAVDSTNALAFRLALGGAAEGTAVVAESQRTGKGRLNRDWFSPAGRNLYLSVILRPPLHPSKVPPITFLSSLAVADTIEGLTALQASLKWPNDVLVNGKKISGTLLELSTEAELVRFVVVGIGFNVNMKATDMDPSIRDKATSLFLETKKAFERAKVCGILLTNLERYYRLFVDGGGDAILALWQERAGIVGRHLEIAQMGERYEGTVEGIDRDGGILLRAEGTVKKIIAGDVAF